MLNENTVYLFKFMVRDLQVGRFTQWKYYEVTTKTMCGIQEN